MGEAVGQVVQEKRIPVYTECVPGRPIDSLL